jgi:hypothetical protein
MQVPWVRYKSDSTQPLWRITSPGGSNLLVVKTMRALLTNFDTSAILQGISGPSWVRHTYFREGGPFQPLYHVCVHFGFFLILVCSLIINWP